MTDELNPTRFRVVESVREAAVIRAALAALGTVSRPGPKIKDAFEALNRRLIEIEGPLA